METKQSIPLRVCREFAENMNFWAERIEYYGFYDVDPDQFKELKENWEKVETTLIKIGKTVSQQKNP